MRFPTVALDLPVRSVAATLDRLRGGDARGSALAVAGWLTIRPSDGSCLIDGPSPASIALCPREAILHDSPDPFLAFQGGEMVRLRSPGIHLHAVALPGRPVALLAERQYRGLGPTLLPVPVVIVGLVGDPRLPACGPAGRDCEEHLSIERIAWVEGAEPLPQTIRLDPSEPAPRTDAAIPGAGAILSETVVPRDSLGGLDPIADAAVDPAVEGSVRYVRTLTPGARVAWAVVDDASGDVLAADPALLGTSAGPFPEAVLGIDVLDVAAARALEAGLDDGSLVAVGGLLSIGPDPECGATWRLQCRRTGLLRAPDGSAAAALFVETAPGVPLPGLRRSTPRLTSWTEAVAAVVVGRFVDGGGRRCGLRRPNCEPVFTVLHLAWLDGSELPTTTSTELGVRATKQTRDVVGVAQAGVGGDSAVLGLTLLSPRTLAAIDPVAAAVLGSEGDGRVWYVTLASPGPAGLEATWALVDDTTGRLLASS